MDAPRCGPHEVLDQPATGDTCVGAQETMHIYMHLLQHPHHK